MMLRAALRRNLLGEYFRPPDPEPIEPHLLPYAHSHGDLVDMGCLAPHQALTFSHELDCWLSSYKGFWIVSTPESARQAFDAGHRVLDA